MQRTLSHMDCFLSCAFHGCRYVGYQTQALGVSVEQVLRRSFANVFGCNIDFHTSSRTDSGVHSRDLLLRTSISREHVERVVGLDPHCPTAIDKLMEQLNANLPSDVEIIRLRWAIPSQIFLRRLVQGKQYSYYWRVGNWEGTEYLKDFTAYEYGPVNVHAMSAAASDIVGEHDFDTFSSAQKNNRRCELKEMITVRSVYSSEISVLTPREFGAEHMSGSPPANDAGIFVPPTYVEPSMLSGKQAANAHPFSSIPPLKRNGRENGEMDDMNVGKDVPYPWVLVTCPRLSAPSRKRKTNTARINLSDAQPVQGSDAETGKLSSGNRVRRSKSNGMPTATQQLPCTEQEKLLSSSGKYLRCPPVRAESNVLKSHDSTEEDNAGLDIPCIIRFRITGNGFLRHQVRRLAGALMAVGKGRMTRRSFRAHLACQIMDELTESSSSAEAVSDGTADTSLSTSTLTNLQEEDATGHELPRTKKVPTTAKKKQRRTSAMEYSTAHARGLWLERTYLYDFAPFELSRSLSLRKKYNLPYLYDAQGIHAIYRPEMTHTDDEVQASESADGEDPTEFIADAPENRNPKECQVANTEFWTHKFWCNNLRRDFLEDHGIPWSAMQTFGFEGRASGTNKWGHGSFALPTVQNDLALPVDLDDFGSNDAASDDFDNLD